MGPMPTPEEITRHHDDGEVVHGRGHPTGYVLRTEEPDPTWPQHYAVREHLISTALGERLVAIQQTEPLALVRCLTEPDLTTTPASSST
jgi:hypothetical protein